MISDDLIARGSIGHLVQGAPIMVRGHTGDLLVGLAHRWQLLVTEGMDPSSRHRVHVDTDITLTLVEMGQYQHVF